MSVPSFKDLGTNARDVFRTGYHYGKSLIKLGVKSRSSETLEMGSDLRLDCDTSKVIFHHVSAPQILFLSMYFRLNIETVGRVI